SLSIRACAGRCSPSVRRAATPSASTTEEKPYDEDPVRRFGGPFAGRLCEPARRRPKPRATFPAAGEPPALQENLSGFRRRARRAWRIAVHRVPSPALWRRDGG